MPQTDQEHQAAKTRALGTTDNLSLSSFLSIRTGFASESKFDVSVRRKQRLLRKSMVTYIGAASNFIEPEITLVLSPITLTPRRDDRDSHFSATVPTVGDTLATLDDLCNDMGEVLKQISDTSAELSNQEHIGLDSAEEILRDIDSSYYKTTSAFPTDTR
ncbi:uncharacterized protein LACBIDRAFT_319026 [Laccaria bicolor S238N-H82]|uniref:Predicted protein n=1 Tax=Laccaria bicolor (strain S238N-H82 / ATCC MYA-4686) TaxID=486041 RepID=B0D7P3_LACBS|nr:uncharacterized protein LACBIDRAFT_319026 [Laccaria bicolor S238N-H82]EDR09686.1 predicted protein [Laccaria bicolor S238N-H82]|eukprot:XP_001880035.1 predicted protein [Laccaria bicolor S238N-H82]